MTTVIEHDFCAQPGTTQPLVEASQGTSGASPTVTYLSYAAFSDEILTRVRNRLKQYPWFTGVCMDQLTDGYALYLQAADAKAQEHALQEAEDMVAMETQWWDDYGFVAAH